MKIISLLVASVTIISVQAEQPFDFRKRLECVHQADRRDLSLKSQSDEFEFAKGTAIVLASNAQSEFMVRVARDFEDYLLMSMKLESSITLAKPGVRGDVVDADLPMSKHSSLTISLDPQLPARAYRVEVGKYSVRIIAADERAAAQGCYHLEDLMNLRKAPFLKIGVNTRRPRFSPRMVHSGWRLDVFPDNHLKQMVHYGIDAILIFVRDVDSTSGSRAYQDIRDVIRRAKALGIDTYIYSYIQSFAHPADQGAMEIFENGFGRVAAAYPDAKGIVLVGESCEFPTKDPRARPNHWRDPRAKGDNRPNAGWFPCSDYPDWLKAVKAAIDRHSKGMEIVFWSYNWGSKPEKDRVALIDALPKDVTLQATFEMFENQEKSNGLKYHLADYTISSEGPGKYFTSEAKAAKRNGLRLYTMSNTGGLCWDFGTVPYDPCPYQWKKRWDKLVKANQEWGLCGLMDSHHFGWWPSFISELSKEAFTEGGMDFETHIRAIAARDFGVANVDAVLSAWKIWSDAWADCYIATDQNQYGPFRIGPSYVFAFGREPLKFGSFPAAPYASAGSRIFRLNYLDRNSYLDKGIGKLNIDFAEKELPFMVDFEKRWAEGAKVFEHIASGKPNSEAAQRMALLGNYMLSVIRTVLNVKRGALAEARKDEAGILAAARDEYQNAKTALDIVEADSRLGWEPTMEYVGGPNEIRWKLALMEKLYNLSR